MNENKIVIISYAFQGGIRWGEIWEIGVDNHNRTI